MAIAHGRNFGAGADLFVACDVRVAAPGTTFRMPGLRFGLQLGTRRLAQRIGNEAARGVLAESRTLDADAALELGFASHFWSFASASSLKKASWSRRSSRNATSFCGSSLTGIRFFSFCSRSSTSRMRSTLELSTKVLI